MGLKGGGTQNKRNKCVRREEDTEEVCARPTWALRLIANMIVDFSAGFRERC